MDGLGGFPAGAGVGQFDLVKSQRFFELGEMFPVVVNQQGGDIMTKSSIVLFCAL